MGGSVTYDTPLEESTARVRFGENHRAVFGNERFGDLVSGKRLGAVFLSVHDGHFLFEAPLFVIMYDQEPSGSLNAIMHTSSSLDLMG